MPWVRLHATKAYLGMARLLESFPEIKLTINLVPSLLAQLEDYVTGAAVDPLLELSLKPLSEISASDRVRMLDHFLLISRRTAEVYERLSELYYKRDGRNQTALKALDAFSNQDIQDLQVWWVLAWIHPVILKKDPRLQDFIKKGRGFSHEDRLDLEACIQPLLADVIPCHRKLQDAGQIEISTTPFYHPIMPLLQDAECSREAMPDCPTAPLENTLNEDLAVHLSKAVDHYKKLFNRAPRGLWPSEGSVSQAIIPAVAKAGFTWMASDEEILLRSRMQHEASHAAIYQPYEIAEGEHHMAILFRDHRLSDKIGFDYQSRSPEDAVADLLAGIRGAGQNTHSEHPLVTIILDGENPWDYYPATGVPFLQKLYEELERAPDIQTVTPSGYLEEFPPARPIRRLFAGSWINSNFDIWMGHPDDRRAWWMVRKAREFLTQNSDKNISKDKSDLAWEELYVAEGSDWYWWYGDDHSSSHDELFDELFRTHLANIYRLMEQEPPEWLNTPVPKWTSHAMWSPPRGLARIHIDGYRTSYFEWIEAGHCPAYPAGGAMQKSDTWEIKDLYFGLDTHALFLRLDPTRKLSKEENIQMKINIHTHQQKHTFAFNVKKNSITSSRTLFDCNGAIGDILELAIPFSELGMGPGDEGAFCVNLHQENTLIQDIPSSNMIPFEVPHAHHAAMMWQ